MDADSSNEIKVAIVRSANCSNSLVILRTGYILYA